MRGKACFFKLADVPAGITPAYAGKSQKQRRVGKRFWDHPRLCGEKSPITFTSLSFLRITPAYAGKRDKLAPAWHGYTDHPRLCGEKIVHGKK